MNTKLFTTPIADLTMPQLWTLNLLLLAGLFALFFAIYLALLIREAWQYHCRRTRRR